MGEILGPLAVLLAIVLIFAPIVSIVVGLSNASRVRALQNEIELLLAQMARLRAEMDELREGKKAPEREIRHEAAWQDDAPGATAHPVAPGLRAESAREAESRAGREIPGAAAPPAQTNPSASAPPPQASAPPIPAQAPPPIPANWAAHAATGPAAATPPFEAPHSTPTHAPAPPASAKPAGPAIDWEAWLGVRGAAWVGGIALAIAGILFAKMAIDQGYFTPPLRFATMLFVGIGSIVGAELILRRGFESAANALCGAGVAVLYAALFAGYGVWHLVGLWPTFALMSLVTVVAGLLAIRHNSMYVAILGLLGGFATPPALSTGVDHPVGLFSYIFLLNLGILWIAVRKGWNVLALLAMAGTLFIEIGWTHEFLTPEKTLIGLIAYGVFGFLYLAMPRAAKTESSKLLLRASIAGAVMPFLFSFYIAGEPAFIASWPLLFGFIAILAAGMALVALARAQAALMLACSIAAAVTIMRWGATGLAAGNVWGAGLCTLGIALLLNFVQRLAPRLSPKLDKETQGSERVIGDAAGLVIGGALLIFMLELVSAKLGDPPWIFTVLLAGASLIAFERSRVSSFERNAALLAPLALAAVAQIWFFNSTVPMALARNLALPVLLATLWTAIALIRIMRIVHAGRRPGEMLTPELDPDHLTKQMHGGGAIIAIMIPLLSLFFSVATPGLKSTAAPLFSSLAVLSILLIVLSALGGEWTALLPAGVIGGAAFTAFWFKVGHDPHNSESLLAIALAFYLGWLALPYLMPERLAPDWRRQPWPWLASGLAGPLFFYVIYKTTVAAYGKAYIGALPVAMAGLSLAALFEVKRRFLPSDDPILSKQRLRNLALFAAVALGFISVAIPLQLDHQWITIGWALEGLCVWGLYLRLPHVGLKYFGMILFLTVGVRLLLNPHVLEYGHGFPILNWILYTYGVCAACALAGGALLKPIEEPRLSPREKDFLALLRFAPAASVLGLLIIFALLNLEVADFYSTGRNITIRWGERDMARDLTTSVAWGVYAVTLLVLGMWRHQSALRKISLGFLILTIGKVFLYDVSNMDKLYRILSLFGLAVSLLVVSVLYKRFVFPQADDKPSGTEPQRLI